MFPQVSVCPRGSAGLCRVGPRSLSRGRDLCPGGGSLSRGVSVWGGSLSRGGLCPRASLWGSLSTEVVSVQGGSLFGGSLSRDGGLCPGKSLSEGSLSRGSLSRWVGVSVQMGRGSLSGGFPFWRVSVQGSLYGGSLSRGVSVQTGRRILCPGGSLSGGLRMITSGRYASYWNAFLSKGISIWYQGTLFNDIFAYIHIFRTQMFMLIFMSLPDIKIHKELFTDFVNFQFFN